MYQKSVHAGSQSGLSSVHPSTGPDTNGVKAEDRLENGREEGERVVCLHHSPQARHCPV